MQRCQRRGCHLHAEVAVSSNHTEEGKQTLAMIVDTVDLDVLVRPLGGQGHILEQRSQDEWACL